MTNKTKTHALYLLSRRDHSKRELATKLRVKGHEPDQIEIALNDLINAGYLNESRFVENYIHWRRQKGYGPERIALELSSRGITDRVNASKFVQSL